MSEAPAVLDARRRRILLDARSAALAARPAGGAEAVALSAYLVCTCGPERYGLPIEAAAAVLPGRPCARLPGAAPAIRGIVALSGVVVTVIDLSAHLGLGRGPEDEAGRGHLLRLRGQEPPIALLVERVLGVEHVPVPALPDANPDVSLGAHAVARYAPPGRDGAGGFSILDLPLLLRRYRPAA